MSPDLAVGMLWGPDSNGSHMGTTVCQLASQSAPYECSCAENEHYSLFIIFSALVVQFWY